MLELIVNTLKKYQPRDLPVQANAAVLVPLFMDGDEVRVAFIHRAEDTGPHSGQMGFPGGMTEVRDRGDLMATALRESKEEVGIRPGDVEIIGTLAQRRTILTSLTVKPFVGIIPVSYPFKMDPEEVQDINTASLRDLQDGVLAGKNPYGLPPPVYPVEGKPVWGLTAKMISELLGLIK